MEIDAYPDDNYADVGLIVVVDMLTFPNNYFHWNMSFHLCSYMQKVGDYLYYYYFVGGDCSNCYYYYLKNGRNYLMVVVVVVVEMRNRRMIVDVIDSDSHW